MGRVSLAFFPAPAHLEAAGSGLSMVGASPELDDGAARKGLLCSDRTRPDLYFCNAGGPISGACRFRAYCRNVLPPFAPGRSRSTLYPLLTRFTDRASPLHLEFRPILRDESRIWWPVSCQGLLSRGWRAGIGIRSGAPPAGQLAQHFVSARLGAEAVGRDRWHCSARVQETSDATVQRSRREGRAGSTTCFT
jgi:hypothetical protein